MSHCRSEPPRCSESPMAGVPHRKVQHLQDRLRVGNCPRFRVTVGGTRGRGGGVRAGRGRGTPGPGGGRVSSRRRTGATGIRSKGPIRRRLWSRRCAGAVTSSVSGRWVGRTELFDFGALGSASAKQARTTGGCRDCDGRGRAPSRSRISVARLLLARPTAPTYRTVCQRPRAAAHVPGYRPGGPFRTYSGRPPRGSLPANQIAGRGMRGSKGGLAPEVR